MDGRRAAAISDLTTSEAASVDRVVQEFRDGTTKILISTDVLSRGFDVSQVRGLRGLQVEAVVRRRTWLWRSRWWWRWC